MPLAVFIWIVYWLEKDQKGDLQADATAAEKQTYSSNKTSHMHTHSETCACIQTYRRFPKRLKKKKNGQR